MHAKPDLRVLLKWMIIRSGSVITDVMSLKIEFNYGTNMLASKDEIERRRGLALRAIHDAHGTQDQEHGVTLFVSHHQSELGDDFWLKHCDAAKPTTRQVLDALVLQSHWGDDEDDGIDHFDFTLPANATNYLLSVTFDESGHISGIDMES